jgi:Rha family phage regulatory protein
MDLIKLGGDQTQKMSSKEIAELTGKNHADVLRDIRNLQEQVGNESIFALVDYKDAKGETRPMYSLDKKQTLLLISGYNALLRLKIINRWEELEMQKSLPSYQIEDDDLRFQRWKEEKEEKKKALLLIEQQQILLEEQAPSVKAFKNVVDNSGYYTIDSLSDAVDIGRTNLFKILRDWNWVMKKDDNGTQSTRYCEEQRYGKTIFETIVINRKSINKKRFVLSRRGFELAISKLIN